MPVIRVNLRAGSKLLPALNVARVYVPRGYIRVNLRPNGLIPPNTPLAVKRLAVTTPLTPRTTGTTANPPTLNPSASTAKTFCTPSTISANGSGPWYNSRPGYVCGSSPHYGNGYYPWSAAAAVKRGNSWSGPNTPRLSFDGLNANGDEIWTFVESGWEECQFPIYSDTQTKARTASSITFNIGAGTVTFGFTSCNLNVGGFGSATPQTLNCGVYNPAPAIYLGVGCSCVQSKTYITKNGCPQSVITSQCQACVTPGNPVYQPPNNSNTSYQNPNNGNLVIVNKGNGGTLTPPPPGNGPINKAIIRNGKISPSQLGGPDFSRFHHGGRKSELFQPMSLGSTLSKRKRQKPQLLQENASARLAGSVLATRGDQFGFIVNDPEVALTSFDYFPGTDIESLAKKDLGKRWEIMNWEDFANGSEADLLNFAQTFGILETDLSVAGGVQNIVVIGWVKYQGSLVYGNSGNYLIVYCNKSLPSTITAIDTLNSDYWVLIANNDITAKILCKK